MLQQTHYKILYDDSAFKTYDMWSAKQWLELIGYKNLISINFTLNADFLTITDQQISRNGQMNFKDWLISTGSD